MTQTAVRTHTHRCKECRERMEPPCSDPQCGEGDRWVVLCLRCYESIAEVMEAAGQW